MLQNSFIFLQGINHVLEKHLWNHGIRDWDQFLNAKTIPKISGRRKYFYDKKIIEARKALYCDDSSFFQKNFPHSESYRLYDNFKHDVVFLDIETSGLSPYYSYITMIGLYDGINSKTIIPPLQFDYHRLKKELEQYKLIVTFNGSSFDLPFINKYYPGLLPDAVHIDLRIAARKMDLTGGLKKIEKLLGIQRKEIIQDLNGGDALTLWRMYKATGDEYYLNLLIEYNEDDVINLQKLADIIIPRLKEKFIPKDGCLHPSSSPEKASRQHIAQA